MKLSSPNLKKFLYFNWELAKPQKPISYTFPIFWNDC